MKKILILLTLLLVTGNNFAAEKHKDAYQNYLYSLNLVSKLFSRLTESADIIAHKPERISFKNLAVNFNKKVGVLIINQNNLITLINRGGFKDHHFPNSLRIMQQNVSDLKKILIDNRPLIDNLRIANLNTAEIYDNFNFRIYENDELLRAAPKNKRSKAFKHKVVDNLTQAVVILNECHSKVAALYSKIK
ncbi:hypothetical protein [Mucilaginibacter sp. UR6-11]|uniref:hypothetical protein n=1 Tax=Mucilaginibacter sp. UR6-11 TaxID=1435644 RepID=UPI001E48D736|nr:hypothetical protein [Mucilaginibacter sp. UR6-11]MCC8426686.1 hypothetical protein [Mucilaginibacter sp. UR6-11]